MEAGEGMVAVVRGLKDAGLSVTLVDAGRQYTLLPDTVLHPNIPPEHSSRFAAYQFAWTPSRRDSGVQATDGRYASTYRMMHCHVTPTSPPDMVTEFPPQRPELCPGHGNFLIGGAGSGTYMQSTKCNSLRGGMCWPDGGSVTPRPSIQRDSFTSSLRKYPNLSQERSSEIVERLISFTQAKNALSKSHRSNVSPTRLMDSDVSNQTISLDASCRNNSAKIQRQYESNATVRPKSALNYRLEESPTRERSRKGPVDQETLDSWRRSTFSKTDDVRFLRDLSRKVRTGLKSSLQQQNLQPEKLKAKEKHEPITIDKKIGVESNTNSVNMEIQAAVQMVSREIVTAPIAVPSQRTIAVPLTPSRSQAETNLKILSQCPSGNPIIVPEIEISAIKPDKDTELQTAINDLELSDTKLTQYKGSKSQDEIRRVQNEVLVIQDLHLGTHCSKLHRRSYSRINKSNKFPIKFAGNRERMTEHESKFYEHRCSLVADNSKDVKRFQSYARIFHAEVKPFRTSFDGDVAEILEDWLDLIPFKQAEYCNERFSKEYMFYDFFECLKYFASNPGSNRKHKLKSNILDRLESIPIETKGNRRVVLNRLADILINKFKRVSCKKCNVSAERSKREIKEFMNVCTPNYNEGYMPSTESELKIFIAAELMLYLEKTRSNINRCRTRMLQEDLLDCFIFHMEELHLANEKRCKKSVIKILTDYGFSEYQATDFANILLTHLKESVITNTISPTKVKSETYIVLANVQKPERFQKHVANYNKASEESKTKKIQDYNLDNYTNELCKQIEDWLSSLKLPILDSIEDGCRKRIINDLAGDIIDRQKYLDLNPSSKGSDEAELEHLRYQIFKWTSKLVGEDNFVPKDHAPDLMIRIREIPKFLNSRDDNRSNSDYPLNVLSNVVSKQALLIENLVSDFDFKNIRPKSKLNDKPNIDVSSKAESPSLHASISNSSRLMNVMTMTNMGTSTIRINGSENRKGNQNTKLPCCIYVNKSCQRMKSFEQLEAQYAKFVKDWVQRIPIKVFSPDHEALVERARVELNNSLRKIVSKLNSDPATYYNRFFYEDLLDDAIEDLLDCLPQSPEMKSIRNSLKIELIEKTIHFNDHIKAHEDASFKNKLVKNVITNLRQHGIIDDDHDETIKEREDYQIIKLVEEYLLYTRFKNDNKLISDVFKKNLTQEIGDFVTRLKNNHEKELSNINTVSLKTEIMNALEKVPLPCERTIREEAEDIIMGIEVEQWYNDLPIIPNEDSIEKIHRKREIDVLAMKIKELENNPIKGNSNIELKKEISKFLQKSPLKEDERVNINFMVDELVNRFQNMQKQDLSQNTKRVIFQAPESYEDFDRNVPLASSYIETPKNDISNNRLAESSNANTQFDSNKSEVLLNTQSYIKEPSSYKTFGEALPSSSSYHETDIQWHTLRDSQVFTPKRDITTNTPHYSIPDTSHTYQDKSLNIDEESINQDYFRNSSYQRDFVNNETQTFNMEQRELSSTQYPKGIRTSRGILGVDQAAGPSGYRNENSQNFIKTTKTSVNINQKPTTSIFTDNRINGNLFSHRRENNNIINKDDDKNDLPVNKFSISCQTLQNGDENTVDNKNRFEKPKRFSVATNTDTSRISFIETPIDASTTRDDKLHSLHANKRHPKMDSSEKEDNGVKRKIRLNETDDEDNEYQCRCIERFWRCRRRPKCFSGDDYPPCMPMFFPYPCFL